MGTSEPRSPSTPLPPATDEIGPASRSIGRREFAGLAAAAAAAPAVALLPATGSVAAPGGSSAPPQGRLRLRPDDGVVSALDVPLAASAAGSRSRVLPGRRVRTPVMETTRFAMVGVTWRSGSGAVRARARRTDGRWSGWRTLPPLHDHPDADTAEGRRTPRATEPVWFGPSEAIQVEMTGRAEEPVLALIDPGSRAADGRSAGGLRRTVVADADDGSVQDAADTEQDAADEPAARSGRAPKPKMRTRRAWGANDRWRNGEPSRISTIKQVHVHHTVNSNDYGRADVPALIRGMYRYHTKSLGWSDLGYNFLVDRFGRIWVGRKGSQATNRSMVQGAHTLGFNHASVGVAAIGNFEAGKPGAKVVNAVARVASWKLDRFGRDPLGTISIRSTGSDKYRSGQRVQLPVIDGHRDTNDTACPGRHLYRKVPVIRRRAARRMRRFA